MESSPDKTNTEINELEHLYRCALAAYKNDKSNKDLRRQKSAAKQAWDDKRAKTQDGLTLTCRNCSQQFIFTSIEQKYFQEMNWNTIPNKCQSCSKLNKDRLEDRSIRDSKTKNMCYSYQKGMCPYGSKCKFSHGSRGKDVESIDGEKNVTANFTPTISCKWGSLCTIKKCRFIHQVENFNDQPLPLHDNAKGKKQVKKAMMKSLKKVPNQTLKMKELRKVITEYLQGKNENFSKDHLKIVMHSILKSSYEKDMVLEGKIVKLVSVKIEKKKSP